MHITPPSRPVNMYPYPPRPTDAPDFIGAADNNDRESRKIAHAIDVKRYTDVQNMNTALINTFLTLLPPQAKLAYEAICIMNPNVVFREAFMWFLEKYGTTQALEHKQNLDSMTLPWTPTDGFDAHEYPGDCQRHNNCVSNICNNLQGQPTNLQQMCHTIMTQPPTWTPPINLPPPQHNNNNYHNSYQGRGGGGGGGYGGRGGGHQCNNTQNFPTGPPATQVTAPHPVKRFANMNYCHTHSADVNNGHNSATCTRPGPYYNYQATRNNTMGSSIKGMHKTIMPNAGGQSRHHPGYHNRYTRGATYPPMQMRDLSQQMQMKGDVQVVSSSIL